MHRLINTNGGAEIGVTEKPRFIKKSSTGVYIEAGEQEAEGVAYKGTAYNLQGRTGVGAEETAMLIEFDGGDISAEVKNTGNVATSFTETDTFTVDGTAAEIAMTSSSAYVTYDKATGTIAATDLPEGETATLTGSYTVKATDNSVSNAIVNGDEVVVTVEEIGRAHV